MSETITNVYGLPLPIELSVKKDNYIPRGDISTTALIDSPRVRLLKWKFPYTTDVSERIFSLFGSAVHHIVERVMDFSEMKHYINEHQMMIREFDYDISGTADCFDKETNHLYDYKVTSVWKVIRGIKDCEDWIKQTNIYAYMLRKEGYKVDRISIVAILRDWTGSKAKYSKDSDYPVSNVVVLDVPMYSDDSILRYIEQRVALHKEANRVFFLNDDGSLNEKDLQYCTPKERWEQAATWKIKCNESKRSLKNFEIKTEEDKQAFAIVFQEYLANPKYTGVKMETEPGVDTRCEDFCPVNRHCSYYLSKPKALTLDLKDEEL